MVKSRLFNSGKPEHDLIVKPRHTPHTVTLHIIDKILDALFILWREHFHIVLKLNGNAETIRDDPAYLTDPVIHFVRICAYHNIHAGGLRYRGAGTIVSQLLKDGWVEAVDIEQKESFESGCLFAKCEGIIPAPESCHAIAAAVREALKCKETGEEKVILFNLSGHGLIDMGAYDQFLAGNIV